MGVWLPTLLAMHAQTNLNQGLLQVTTLKRIPNMSGTQLIEDAQTKLKLGR